MKIRKRFLVQLVAASFLLASCGSSTADEACQSWGRSTEAPRESIPFFASLVREEPGYKYLLDAIEEYARYRELVDAKEFIRYSEQLSALDAWEDVELFCSTP